MEDASIAGASGALTLGFGLQFTDLYDRAGLERLDRAFLAFLKNADEELQGRLVQARLQGNVLIERLSPSCFSSSSRIWKISLAIFSRSRLRFSLSGRGTTSSPRSTRSSGRSCSAGPPRAKAPKRRRRSMVPQ